MSVQDAERKPNSPAAARLDHNTTPLSFLDLPSEVRIYDLSIRHVKLSKFRGSDDSCGHLRSYPGKAEIHALPMTCRQVCNETIGIFYSRATPAVEPLDGDQKDIRSRNQFLERYERRYEFCPKELLRQIKSVHLYNSAKWPTYLTFQALFIWLVQNTDVDNIWASSKVLEHWKYIPRLIDLNGMRYPRGDGNCHIRTINLLVWSTHGLVQFSGCTRLTPLVGQNPPAIEIQVYEARPKRPTPASI